MQQWDKQVAAEEKALLVDHTTLAADAYEKIGQLAVAKYFNADTAPAATEGGSGERPNYSSQASRVAPCRRSWTASTTKARPSRPTTTAPATSNP